MNRVSFQGERGAYSEAAALAFFKDKIETIPLPTFANVLENTDLHDGSDLVDYFESGLSLPGRKVKQILTEAEKDISILYRKNKAIHKLIETFDLTDELGFKIRI